MYRFFIKEEQIHDGMIEICGSDVNHIKNVLRMKTGDKVYLSNGSDSDTYPGKIHRYGRPHRNA